MKSLTALAIACLAMGMVTDAPVVAQNGDPSNRPLSVHSSLVLMPVLVKTRSGEIVFSLTAQDFLGEMGDGRWGTDETIPQSAASEFGGYFVCHRSPFTRSPFTQSLALNFSEGVAQFEEGPRRGLLARDGTVILGPKYWAISEFSGGIAYVWDGKHYGFINLRGEEVIPLFFERAREFRDGLAPAKLNGKWGYINRNASYEVEPIFDFALPFSEGLACVLINGKWGYVDRNGEFLLPPRFASAFEFRAGMASASLERKGLYGYIDRVGNFVIQPAFTYPKYFSEGLAAVTPQGQRFQHFINPRGEQAFVGEYLTTESFQSGRCLVSTLETIAYIDQHGEVVWTGPYVDKI